MNKSSSSSPKHSQSNNARSNKYRNFIKNANLQQTHTQTEIDELLIASPLQSFTAARGHKFKASFSKFLAGNIDTKQLIDHSNFPTKIDKMNDKYEYVKSHKESVCSFKDQIINKEHLQSNLLEEKLAKLKIASNKMEVENKRERIYELSLQVKKDKRKLSKQENALLRWKKIKDVIQNNIQLRRMIIEEKRKQTKFLDNLEIAFHKSSEFYIQNLRFHQLRTMTVLKEKKLFHSNCQNLSPRHYHFMLSLQFKENSDNFLFTRFTTIPEHVQNQMKNNDQIYDRILNLYLNKKDIYLQWVQEQKYRKVIKWKQSKLQVSNDLHSNTASSSGLNKHKPMQRVQNPFQQTQRVKDYKSKLIEQVNDVEHIDQDSRSQLKQLLQKSNNKKKNSEGVIKHNRFLSYPSNSNNDQIDDFQDNISNASITEALLDQLYSGANNLQQKINNNKGLTFQRKVRDYLRLEEIKLQTIRANNLKLIPKQNY
ncbi:unnamed protein product (macronuclear) [Paramecium tetraurelia]|uniref:DUF4200 domain-containing protein n=1 Tax=Paramecium tetraurelia TaxID=5888 RepID=A0DJG4_PARTE|nr:uncharacterized protein GSPATT00017525001 [Paramecium tetraurelia]CAK83181.1 unnamed protein product [Paramecium tetraurelia]|eukprot:XP_001450578.1 hypothetical protein (macronuclear) [Paramecium tetraurelia strain d4-2]